MTLTVCCGFALFAQQYVSYAVSDQLEAVADLELFPDESKAPEYIGRLEAASREWNSKRKILCIFISHRDFDDIDNQLISLKSAVISRDVGNYTSSLELLKERLAKLRLSETLSFEGIA